MNYAAKVIIKSDWHKHNVNQGLNVNGMVCHVGNAEHRQTLFNSVIDEDGKLDILISNAAVNPTFGLMLGNTTVHITRYNIFRYT